MKHLLALSIAIALASACTSGGMRAVEVSGPVTTSDDTVWWLDMRAAARGSNDVHVIMCRRGERPVCVRLRPAEVPAR